MAWVVLGTGILLGAEWSYEELGWGGYWGWDPVENGSLVPWLTGSALGVAALVAALVLDTRRRPSGNSWLRVFGTLAGHRRQYAGFLIHMGFICIAIGITGSSLGTRRHELVMQAGDTIEWAGRSIRFVELQQQELPGKFVAAAVLEVSGTGGPPFRLLPAQHLHRLQNQWTTEVAIHSSWSGDFYTILHNGEDGGGVRLTLVENPMMRWLWFGGWVVGTGALIAVWPSSRRGDKRGDAGVSRAAMKKVVRSEKRDLVAAR